MIVRNPRVEYRSNPMALDIARPRFSWEIENEAATDAGSGGCFQAAYQILVTTGSDYEGGELWDSGRVDSGETLNIEYKGTALQPHTRYFWRVRAWDSSGTVSEYSPVQYWTTGFMDTRWDAQWITPQEGDEQENGKAPLLRREFMALPFRRATAYVFAYGWYELYINGFKADDRVLAPANSREHSQFFDVYDVTAAIKNGNNAIGLWLGDGYSNNFSQWGWRWTGPKRAIMEIRLELEDGSVQTVLTDKNWRYTVDGPITDNHIYNGERYDARHEVDGWSTAGFDDSSWRQVRVLDRPRSALRPSPIPPLRVTQLLPATCLTEPSQGSFVCDFGQNIAGWARLRIREPAGTAVTLRYAEVLDENGHIDTYTYRSAKATDVYISCGDERWYEPRFTYHGFRYVEITGLSRRLEPEDIAGCVVHTDLCEAGSFSCDNAMINQLYSNMRWSIRDNSYSCPTDCPSRDERTPCFMDTVPYQEMASFLFDAHTYYTHWLRLNFHEMGTLDTPDWNGNQISFAWNLYHQYGDLETVREGYPLFIAYIDKCIAKWPGLIITERLGDWCAPSEEPTGTYQSAFSNIQETNTALFYYQVSLVVKMACLLGHIEDAKRLESLCKAIAQAYHHAFYVPDHRWYSNGTQTPSLLPLQFGMVPASCRKGVLESLLEGIVVRCGGHLDTGIFGTKYLPELLADEGHIDTALAALCMETYPGFGFQIRHGATTLWEQWCERGSMASHNHAMFAGAGASFFTRLAGIQNQSDAYRRIHIRPVVPSLVSHVKCIHHTVRGTVAVEWSRSDDDFELCVEIPANCTARIEMPDGRSVYEIDNGTFKFTCSI